MSGTSTPHLTQTELRNALALFLFCGDDVFQTIGTLSGGERARVLLLTLMLARDNLLMLDEPTNHLDLKSCESLEAALTGYHGTLFVISHDRYLINRLANRILVMTPGGLREYRGGYDDYLASVQKEVAQAAKAEAAAVTEEKAQKKQQKENKAEQRKLRAALRRLESEIEQLEQKIAAEEQALLSPEIASDYTAAMEHTAQLEELQAQELEKMEQWEQLSSQILE